ncbi:MAG: serine/threonine kinase family protein [Myxococcales bacterium]|nr:serine/threonine kinase family protein [Myxococcales bacterium]
MPSPASCPDEETLLAFVEGRQSDAIRAGTASHLDGCDSCRDVVAAVAPALFSGTLADLSPMVPVPRGDSVLPRGTNVGRYVVLALVGRGGMGEVYAAYDPELDRKVALKLLHEGGLAGGTEGRARLLREAKAIAKLSHPNVVVVHDAGTIDDRVFIAMEFVDGRTLAVWLTEAQRSWREIRDIFLDAGRALSAAHAAGLVHRDFKPQNVMVGDDGKVRVMDFGLAARDDAAEGGVSARGELEGFAKGTGALTATAALTRTGTLVGTPAYMAPEQFLATATDARTDQFSFCVSLHEALFGQRPFPGKTLAELATSVVAGKTIEPAQKGRAPVWLRRVIARGLQTKREQRWPSMDELLAILARDPDRQRRRVVAIVAAGVILLGGGAIAQRAVTNPQATLCRGAGARLAGAWELPTAEAGPRHEVLRAAFVATGVGYAEDTWRRTAKILDDYAGRWSAMYTTTCEATQLRGEQSTEVMDLKMDCLGQALDGLGSLTTLLSHASADVVVEAVNAALALPELDRCSNVALLRAVAPPPRDPKLRARIDDIRHRNAQMKALGDTGQSAAALGLVDTLMRDARDANYAPAETEVLVDSGLLYVEVGNPDASLRALDRAFWLALESRQDELAADAATILASVIGRDAAGKVDEARWEQLSEALLGRLGPGHDRTRSWLYQARGNMAYAVGNFVAAQAAYKQAAALKESALGADHPDFARSLDSLANALLGAGAAAEALGVHERALGILERAYGRDSPLVSFILSNHAEILNKLHRPREAIALFQRALDLKRRVGAPDSPDLGYPLTGLGQALLMSERGAEAVAPLEQALRVREKNDPDPERLGETRFALARALAARAQGQGQADDRTRARALATAARDDYAKAPSSPTTTEALTAIDRWRATTAR